MFQAMRHVRCRIEESAIQFVEANGARIPIVGLGTWDLRGKTCARMVEAALKLGYRHIDTAAMYDNEDEVARPARGRRRSLGRLGDHEGVDRACSRPSGCALRWSARCAGSRWSMSTCC